MVKKHKFVNKTIDMGIRLKILLGFVILSSMLFISGALSIYELTKQSSIVKKMFIDSYRSIDYAKRMLDELEKQEKTLFLYMGKGNPEAKTIYTDCVIVFKQNLDSARLNITFTGEAEMIDSINFYFNLFNEKALMVFDQQTYSLQEYLNSIHSFEMHTSEHVKKLMLINQKEFSNSAAYLEASTQRSVFPGFVVIVSSLIFTFIFTYLVNHYFVSPIIRLTKGINDFVKFQRPFDVPIETRDEIFNLKDSIKNLISFNQSIKNKDK